MEELGCLMDKAVQCAETDLEKERVESWRKGVWDYMVEGRRQYEEEREKTDN